MPTDTLNFDFWKKRILIAACLGNHLLFFHEDKGKGAEEG